MDYCAPGNAVQPMKRILVVEDNLTLLPFVTHVNSQRGYITEAVSRYGDGIRLAQSSDYCLFLIDVNLPDGSGIDLCRHIRAVNDGIPVVLFSADHGYESFALEAGANAFLRKGSGLKSQLDQMISNLIERQASPSLA
jgi:CheY-like chemotaxis protein